MTEHFDRHRGLISVETRLVGPSGHVSANLALDSGAVYTMVRPQLLQLIGYHPDSYSRRVRIISATGQTLAPQFMLARMIALGQKRQRFALLGHALPAAAGYDGVLGLGFVRGLDLTISFRRGEISLE